MGTCYGILRSESRSRNGGICHGGRRHGEQPTDTSNIPTAALRASVCLAGNREYFFRRKPKSRDKVKGERMCRPCLTLTPYPFSLNPPLAATKHPLLFLPIGAITCFGVGAPWQIFRSPGSCPFPRRCTTQCVIR